MRGALLLVACLFPYQIAEGYGEKEPKKALSARKKEEDPFKPNGYFKPLRCNKFLHQEPCVSWSTVHRHGRNPFFRDTVVVNCGECLVMDMSHQTLTFPRGLDIRGRLIIKPKNLTLVASHLIVQGELEIKDPSPVNGRPSVTIDVRGDQNKYFVPWDNNRLLCSSSRGCEAGPNSITVAGGKVNLIGINSKAPTITTVEDVNNDFNAIFVPRQVSRFWRPGSEIVIASSNLFHDDEFVRRIVSSRVKGKFVRLGLDEPLPSKPATAADDKNFATEVALLSRNILFTSESRKGGHFWVLQTPKSKQEIRGVEITKFGQQGELGRYPLHIHYCKDARNSIISQCSIHRTRQRGIVIHGTDSLRIRDNVLYDIKGHAFMLEDGTETNNKFIHNIGIRIEPPQRLIPEHEHGVETDDTCSVFWMTNTNNTWVRNIVAGSARNGFWFELLKRGKFVDKYPDLVPMEQPMGKFERNVIHSTRLVGLEFYQDGYIPNTLQFFDKNRLYRNNNVALRLHRSRNLVFRNTLLADNGVAVRVDRAEEIHLRNSRIIGLTQAYSASVQQFQRHIAPCRGENNEQSGLEFPRDNTWAEKLDSELNGVLLNNVRFGGFFDTTCRRVHEVHLVPRREHFQTFDMFTRFQNVRVRDIDFCDAPRAAITDAYITSMGHGRPPSTFVVNTAEMRRFLDLKRCPYNAKGCHLSCRKTCFRTVHFYLNPDDGGKYSMRVCDRRDLTRCLRVEEHMRERHRKRRFAIHVPSGRKYDVVLLNKRTGLPVFFPEIPEIEVIYKDKLCPIAPNDDDIELQKLPRGQTFAPTSSPTTFQENCEDVVVNSAIDTQGTDGWLVQGKGFLSTTSRGANGLALRYHAASRKFIHNRVETILEDPKCFTRNTFWKVSMKVQLLNATTGLSATCDTKSIIPGVACPLIHVYLRDQSDHVYNLRLVGRRKRWKKGAFNELRAQFAVFGSEWEGRAAAVRLGLRDFPIGTDVVLDDVRVERVTPHDKS